MKINKYRIKNTVFKRKVVLLQIKEEQKVK